MYHPKMIKYNQISKKRIKYHHKGQKISSIILKMIKYHLN